MIPQLPGWSMVARNGGLTLTPREGASCGAIRYQERLRPLQPVAALLAAMKSGEGRFSLSRIHRPEPLLTQEGEYAAVVVVDGKLAGIDTPVQRSIGYVFGDDFYARIAGLALRPDQFLRFHSQVRALVHADCHYLGVRRRRYLFRPPAGYFGVERSLLHAYYYPRGYPRDPTVLCVYPAMPLAMWDGNNLPHQLRPIQGLLVEQLAGPFPCKNGELTGESWELSGSNEQKQAILRQIVVLSDDRYAYPLSLDTRQSRPAEHIAAFQAVVQSVQRLPGTAPARSGPSKPGLLGHWA